VVGQEEISRKKSFKYEGLLPQCNNCGIFQKKAHSDLHSNSKECKHYANTKRKRKQELIQYAAKNV
jgi:hypothetical protein